MLFHRKLALSYIIGSSTTVSVANGFQWKLSATNDDIKLNDIDTFTNNNKNNNNKPNGFSIFGSTEKKNTNRRQLNFDHLADLMANDASLTPMVRCADGHTETPSNPCAPADKVEIVVTSCERDNPWYYDPKYGKCARTPGVPPKGTLFPNLEACCEEIWGSDGTCSFDDGCTGPKSNPTPSPTVSGTTSSPTESADQPGQEVPSPTPLPTPLPTPSPTQTEDQPGQEVPSPTPLPTPSPTQTKDGTANAPPSPPSTPRPPARPYSGDGRSPAYSSGSGDGHPYHGSSSSGSGWSESKSSKAKASKSKSSKGHYYRSNGYVRTSHDYDSNYSGSSSGDSGRPYALKAPEEVFMTASIFKKAFQVRAYAYSGSSSGYSSSSDGGGHHYGKGGKSGYYGKGGKSGGHSGSSSGYSSSSDGGHDYGDNDHVYSGSSSGYSSSSDGGGHHYGKGGKSGGHHYGDNDHGYSGSSSGSGDNPYHIHWSTKSSKSTSSKYFRSNGYVRTEYSHDGDVSIDHDEPDIPVEGILRISNAIQKQAYSSSGYSSSSDGGHHYGSGSGSSSGYSTKSSKSKSSKCKSSKNRIHGSGSHGSGYSSGSGSGRSGYHKGSGDGGHHYGSGSGSSSSDGGHHYGSGSGSSSGYSAKSSKSKSSKCKSSKSWSHGSGSHGSGYSSGSGSGRSGYHKGPHKGSGSYSGSSYDGEGGQESVPGSEPSSTPKPPPTAVGRLPEDIADLPPTGGWLVHDEVTTNMNVPIVVEPLLNDIYIPADAVGSMTQPSNGESTPQENGVMYTPNPDFCGTDSFTYTVADPYGTEGSDTATVLINVLCPDTPMAEFVVLNDDEVETMANNPISIAVLENDFVPSDATGTIGQPLYGTCDFSGADIVYTPNTDFCGEDEFTYTVTDSSKEHSDTATVYVNVLCPGSPTRSPIAGDDDVPEPPIANDDEATTNQGSSVVLDVLANDVVPANVGGSFTTPSNGRLEKGTSQLVYTPNEDFCGTDSFDYTISNQDFSDTATVFIDVICSPEEGEVPPKTNATTELPFTDESPPTSLTLVDDFAEGNMDEELSIPILSNDFIPSDSAAGGFTEPSHGTIVEPTENGLIYSPDTGFCGYDSFDYNITSNGVQETASVAIHILCDDDAVGSPFAVPIDATTTIGTQVSIPLGDKFDLDQTEVDITYTPSDGVLETGVDNSLLYTPNAGFVGKEVLDYSLCNIQEPIVCSEATITILVIVPAENDEEVTTQIMEKASNDIAEGAVTAAETQTSSVVALQSGEDSEDESQSSYGAILGAAVGGVFLALLGTSAFVRKRRKLSKADHPLIVNEFSSSSSSTEAASLSSEHANSREIDFAGRSKNLSVAAFLTGEAAAEVASSSSKRSKRSLLKGKSGSGDSAPVSPANSLFSVATSNGSKKDYNVDDVVDL